MRRVYVVETVANPKVNPNDLYSKHIVYIDAEADVVLSHDMYDRRGELMVNFTNWLTYRDRPVPDVKIAIYPFQAPVPGQWHQHQRADRAFELLRPRRQMRRNGNAGTSIWAR